LIRQSAVLKTCAALVLSILITGVGEAQTVREACVTDAAKLCPDATDLDSRIQCMNAHQADLSEGCRKAHEANRGARGADSGVADVDLINIIKEFDLRLHSRPGTGQAFRERGAGLVSSGCWSWLPRSLLDRFVSCRIAAHFFEGSQARWHIRRANFRRTKILELFDFDRVPTLNRALAHDLATARYLKERSPILIVGASSADKSHLD
jgi:hypothetical protein